MMLGDYTRYVGSGAGMTPPPGFGAVNEVVEVPVAVGAGAVIVGLLVHSLAIYGGVCLIKKFVK